MSEIQRYVLYDDGKLLMEDAMGDLTMYSDHVAALAEQQAEKDRLNTELKKVTEQRDERYTKAATEIIRALETENYRLTQENAALKKENERLWKVNDDLINFEEVEGR
jgi:hypothetical protein